jgi:phospholipid-binding lipoprotein MlaA
MNKLIPCVLLIAIGLLTGCATTANNPKDPWEGANRVMFDVNEGIDKALIKPAAQAYDAVTPVMVQQGVTNFFANLNDIPTALNSLLQGKGGDAAGDLSRVLINTTFGLFGLVDVATQAGLERHDEDFGQTFGVWGWEPPGPYVFIPVLGPHNVRDAFGMVANIKADISWQLTDDISVRNATTALRIVNFRSQLLPADKIIEEAAMDKYAYIRDAYLQRRRYLVYDGDPPREKEDF